jgi:hypothetical protein
MGLWMWRGGRQTLLLDEEVSEGVWSQLMFVWKCNACGRPSLPACKRGLHSNGFKGRNLAVFAVRSDSQRFRLQEIHVK